MTRVTWTDEQLSAFLDGELASDEMEALSRDIEADRGLAARVARLSGANAAYQTAIGAIDEKPMSAGLKAAMAAPPAAEVIPFRARNVVAFVMEHRAIAAAMVAAAAVWSVSSLVKLAGEAPPDVQGYILASSPLYRVLEQAPSSVPVQLGGGIEATPRLSFATASGDFCRQYRLESGTGGSEAIACHEADRWRIEVEVFGAPGSNGDYQTAAGPASQTLDAFIDRVIEGEPLGAGAEADAIRSGWRSR